MFFNILYLKGERRGRDKKGDILICKRLIDQFSLLSSAIDAVAALKVSKQGRAQNFKTGGADTGFEMRSLLLGTPPMT